MHRTFISGLWGPRPVTIFVATKQIAKFLTNLGELSPIFSTLRLPSRSRKEAMKTSFIIEEEAILKILKKSRKNDGLNNEGFCELGFALHLFNEFPDNASLSINFSIGSNSRYYKNTCIVKLHGKALDESTSKKIIELIVEIFNPEIIRHE